MPLAAGTRFGPYEISGLIGAGGMGEVYRARDTKLDRDVAIKVLPAAFTGDAARLVRFEREARTLASLNHPHIAHVYGLEDGATMTASAAPARALVMELVEGEDLAERIARGPMPVADILSMARQIADAIGSAHEKGIVHRDLKPANIKVTPDGTVKVLDFGLAKALERDPAGAVSSSTVTSAGTLQGVILGTAAYMSPEQARGQAVDARTDVWAFGCVLFEMLAGGPAFPGATASDTIAKILEREPDWRALPPSTPPTLRRLLTRCLDKDPKRRLHAIADARFELDEALIETNPRVRPLATRTPARIGRWPVVATVVVLILAAGAWRLWPTRPEKRSTPRVTSLTSYPGNEQSPSFSPDGKQVAFSWGGAQGDNEDIYIVIVGSDSPLPVTRHAARDVSPAWKPDGSQIAFARVEAGRVGIYVVSPLGESEQKLTEFSAVQWGGAPDLDDPLLSWSPDSRWLAVSRVALADQGGVFLVAADGSSRRLLLPSKERQVYAALAFSPKGDELAYANSGYLEVVKIVAGNPPSVSGPPRRLTSFLGYVNGLAWTADGKEVLFGRAQNPTPSRSYLWRLDVSGDRAAERIDLADVGGSPAVSAAADRLAYSRRSLNVDLLRLQEGHDPEAILASTFNEHDGSFSPDGKKVAFTSDRTGEGNEIWVATTADGSGRRSVTQGTHKPEGTPRWSPDGKRLAFDGLGNDGQRHIYVVDEAGGLVEAFAFKAGVNDQIPSWSRDGKWIYFGSTRTGRSEIWRAPVGGGDAQAITTTGGDAPFESWDGKTLYFTRPGDQGRTLHAMPVSGGPERSLGAITWLWNYVPVKDGLVYMSVRQGQKASNNCEVRSLDVATGMSRVLYSLRLAVMMPGLSVLADGRTVLVSGAADINSDLVRIENFR